MADSTALDQANVRAGTAHVTRDDVLDPSLCRHCCGTRYPASGSRQYGGRRKPPRSAGCHDAAARLHDEEWTPAPAVGQPILQVAEVAVHQRRDDSVENRGTEPLVFAVFPNDRGGDCDGCFANQFTKIGGGLLFVRGIGVRVKKADNPSLERLAIVARERRLYRLPRDGLDNSASGPGSLNDAEPRRARDQWRLFLELQVIQLGPLAAANLDNVLEPPCHKHADAAALSLKHGVGRHRRPVHHEIQPW